MTRERIIYESPKPKANAPIACTFDLANASGLRAGLDAYRAVFALLLDTERFEGGFRWRFRHTPELETHLPALAQNESACCSFFQFTIRIDGEAIVWETTADAHATSMLDEYSRLPERLRAEPRPSHDVAFVKQSAEQAGLVFTSTPNERKGCGC